MAFLISQLSFLFIVTQYHGNKYGRMKGQIATIYELLEPTSALIAPRPNT
jgi:hypothetical protein